jgi:hypothetical protein
MDGMAIGPLTHTVSYAGHQFQVATDQAGRMIKAMSDARLGLTTLMGIPVTDLDTGPTVARHLIIGPGTPILIEGPLIDDLVM